MWFHMLTQSIYLFTTLFSVSWAPDALSTGDAVVTV